MRSSYSEDDVEFLLKDMTGQAQAARSMDTPKNCELRQLEGKPSDKCVRAYMYAIFNYAKSTADAIGTLAEKIYRGKGRDVTIVSIVGESTPVGVLVHRYLKNKYQIPAKHYAVSFIEDYGLDRAAMDHILQRHRGNTLQVIGSTAYGHTACNRLQQSLAEYNGVDNSIAVVTDPGAVSEIYGTREDILIPSDCLNAVASGLISKPFLSDSMLSDNDFFGAIYFSELEQYDLSNDFIFNIERYFNYKSDYIPDIHCVDTLRNPHIIRKIMKEYHVDAADSITLGIGPTTRGLLMRIPDRVIINRKYRDSEELKPVYQLANERGIPFELASVELQDYKVCGIMVPVAESKFSENHFNTDRGCAA